MENMNVEFKDVVRIVGEIGEETLHDFIKDTDVIMASKLQYDEDTQYLKEEFVQPFPRITLEITSPGGSVDVLNAMLGIINKMRKMNIKIDTHVDGMAYSAAFILAIVGERRTASEFTNYMNHSSSAWLRGKLEEMKNTIAFYEKCDEKFNNLIEKYTDLPKEHIEMAKLKDMYYDYDEAIEYGLVNVYEGMEETKEEYVEKLSKAFDLSIKTFSKVANSEEGDSIFILYDMLTDVIEMLEEKEEEVKEKAEKKVKTTKEKTDDEELLEKAKEILDSIELCKKEGNKCEKCEFKKECEEDEKEALEILGLEDEEDDEE